MDDSLDLLKDGATPRTLLRRFMAVADVQETPIPFRTRGAAAKNASIQKTQSGPKKRKSSRLSKGEQSMSREVLRQQAKQSSSFMDQTLNASVIQGANQTYANIVPQDSDSSSSLITSFDMEKAAKWQKRKKKKLEDASVPAEVVPKPPAKKKRKKKDLPSTNSTTESLSEEGKSGEKAADTTNIIAQEVQPDEPETQSTQSSTEANAAENESLLSLPSTASPTTETEKIISDVSGDVSSIGDGSYSFISEKDDSHISIKNTKVRFGSQIKSRQLNLPSIIELLPAKQKSADPQTVTSAEDAFDAPDMQAPPPESSAPSPEASQESGNRTSQDISNDFILPPLSFRDEETSTTDILREANFSAHDLGKRISATYIHQEEPEASQGLLNIQEEDTLLDLKGTPADQLKALSEVITPAATPRLTRSAQKSVAEVAATTTPTPTRSTRKSVGEVAATTTPTPTRSTQKSVGEVAAITTPTPTRSTRKSVGEVAATTTPTPTRPTQKSVGEVAATTTPTPTRSTRKSVGEVTTTTIPTPTRSAQKSVAEVTATTPSTPTRSAQKSVAEVTATNPSTPTRSAQKSVAEVAATTTPTPTRSARKSVAEVAATITPTRSARKNLVEVAATTTPTRLAQKSVAEVTATTTPTRLAQKSVAEVTATTTPTPTRSAQKSVAVLASPQTDKTVKDTSTTGSPRQTRMSQASDAWQVSEAIASLPSNEGTGGPSSHPPVEESHNSQEIGKSQQHASEDNEDDIFEDDSPSKKRRISGSLSRGAAQNVLPEDAIEEAPLSDSEDEYASNLEPLQLSFHGSDKSATSASPVNALKVKTTSTTKPKAQPSTPFTTAKVRQMTLKEFLEQLKTKPVPPPVPKPKPLLAGLLGAPSTSKTSAKPLQKHKQKKGTKKSQMPATFPRSVTKEVFTHFSKCRVTAAAVNEVMNFSGIFWSNLTKDIYSLASETSNQIEASTVEKVMKRIKIITPEQSLNSLVEELLPMEMWNMFLPFPDVAKNPFPPITGQLSKVYQSDDLENEEEETAG
ncbi:proteoglycan 4-like isoform X2 [Portunus trituberculatus]|uniref:proteoglycan 4-like isoform X2 n=1 Tax=Portunus trituberculatus TaxID=210409 RepID=UPI001E1CF639|nr:proteoglycan 4-like isoform X2 [Portunus trituberculatus]